MPHDEGPAFLWEGMAWQTITLSWWETDENGVRWERQKEVTAAGVLNALREERVPDAQTEMVECCSICEQPKSRMNMPGEEREKGWPACINPACPAFGEATASACYRPRRRPPTHEEVRDG